MKVKRIGLQMLMRPGTIAVAKAPALQVRWLTVTLSLCLYIMHETCNPNQRFRGPSRCCLVGLCKAHPESACLPRVTEYSSTHKCGCSC